MLELALALEYVHGNLGPGPMMHRDLKSVSFLVCGVINCVGFSVTKYES